MLTMRKYSIVSLCLLLPLTSGCPMGVTMVPDNGDGPVIDDGMGNDDMSPVDDNTPAARAFTATLVGEQEVPPVETTANGTATFTLNDAGDELAFEFQVNDGFGITSAHIHNAPVGQSGGAVVTLFDSGNDIGVIGNGTINDDVITADSLQGDLAGMTLDDLLAILRSGDAYINVHTANNPPGEIRGQIEAVEVVDQN